MITETWILLLVIALVDDSGDVFGGSALFRLIRLLRLTRMTRMMRALPELAAMVKGMIAAVRAVSSALMMLILIIYVFSIMMHALVGDEYRLRREFSNIRHGMVTLLISGVLLDDVKGVTMKLIAAERPVAIMLFAVFVFLTALTVMNMLIGVLCDVVNRITVEEKELDARRQIKGTLLVMLEGLDIDGSGTLTKKELQEVLHDPVAVGHLNELQVDVQHLLHVTEMLYDHDDDTEGAIAIPISYILHVVLSFRGTRSLTMHDLSKGYNYMNWAMKQELAKLEVPMKAWIENAINESTSRNCASDTVSRPPTSIRAAGHNAPQGMVMPPVNINIIPPTS
jgi:hypothetical protein